MPSPTAAVLAAWGFGPAASLELITTGLINLTFRVSEADRCVALQRLHPIFDGRVNADIDRITAHLSTEGMDTPRIVRTEAGALYLSADDGAWRALSWVEGELFERADSPARAEAAGRLVGRFHTALAGFAHEFAFSRPDAHDFSRHLRALKRALGAFANHDAHAEAARLAARIVGHAQELSPTPALPLRIIHGDLKLTNLLFDSRGEGLAVIDLDTMCHGRMDVELGDALRSWCNPAGEDVAESEVDAELLVAALEGFEASAPGLLSELEWQAIVPGMERIALELSSRFARDALEQERFGWDPERFASRSAHNLRRAHSQLALATSIRERRDELRARVGAIRAR